MTDYLEEGPDQGEALLQALEAMVLWIPAPDGREAEADVGISLPATDLCIQGSSVSPAERREPDREDAPGASTGAEAPPIRGGKVDGEEALPLLSVLLERERTAAVLNKTRTAQEISGMRQSGGGLEAGPIPFHRSFSHGGGLGMGPDSRRPEPDWAREAESASAPSIRQMDQAFRRDSRRYDGGFFLY